jgi:tetratricopeptide (TPR) repeat protein
MPLADLLPGQILDHYRFHIGIKYQNLDLGHVIWQVRPYVEDWLEKANRIIKHEQRLEVLKRALGFLPENRKIQLRLLEEYKALGMWKEAARLLEGMFQKRAQRKILLELREAYRNLNDIEGVISVYKRVLELDPGDNQTRRKLANKLEEIGREPEAVEVYAELLKQIEGEGDEKLSVYKKLGYLCTKLEQNDRAIDYYQKAAKLDQKDANLYYNLAYLYEQKGEQDKANFYLANAVTLTAEDVEGRLKLAEHLIARGNLKKARQYLEEVLKLRENNLDALLLTAGILEKQARKEPLKDIYRRILAIEPDNATVRYNLGVLEFETGDLRAGEEHLRGYLRHNPQDAEALALLFEIYRREDKHEPALRTAEKLSELRPKEAGIYDYMFEQLDARGDYPKMRAVMEKAVKANPETVAYREYLLLAYVKLGKEKLAMEQIETILKVEPENVRLWLHLARLREKHGKMAQALKAYKQIIEIAPGNKKAEEAYLRLRLKGVRVDGEGG